MKQFVLALLCSLFAFSVSAQEKPLHGIDTHDLDRKASPCNDFYDFANGTWRAKNPIPASMVMWSRRWAAGEATKDVLHGILEDAAKNAESAPPKSTDRLIGDYYAACMDQKAIDALGIKALAREMAWIHSVASTDDLQPVIQKLNEEAIYVPFIFGSSQDPHNPQSVIADAGAAGIGLPERDYYFKDDAKSKETRDKYLEHIAAMFVLAGTDKPTSAANAKIVMRMETAFAGASLKNVELRDPHATDHKMTLDEVQKLTPGFNWSTYFETLSLDAKVSINVDQPKFLEEFQKQLKETSVDDWKVYLTWHVLLSAAPSLSTPFVQENFAFYQKYLQGAAEMKPHWKRCVEATDNDLGEALGKKYVEKAFSPEAKARMQEMVKNILLALHDDIQTLTWMSDDTKKKALEKLATFNPKVGYPNNWKDYSTVEITRDAFWADVISARRFAVKDDANLIGKPVDRGRWHFAPADVRRERQRRRQLRRHRPRDRPRNLARLRRSRRAVRRNRRTEKLVDARRLQRLSEPRQVRRRSVRLLHRGRRPARKRQARPRREHRRSRRRQARLSRVRKIHAGQAPPRQSGRLHTRAAILHFMGPIARR
jgi:putative endopeptidase